MTASPASPRRALVLRCSAALIAASLAASLCASLAGGCAQQTVVVPTRSLERSGRASFVCLAEPRLEDPNQLYKALGQARPITDCTLRQVLEISEYSPDDDAGVPIETDAGVTSKIPHLYSLVTQTTRGEVAVVDVTAKNNPVLDEDPSVPGANFLPIGAQPVDVVSTPGGTASFVGVAEVGREGIFALPSSKIRPASADPDPSAPELPAPQISTWPACRLPSAPGQMLLLADPPQDQTGDVRESCDTAYHTAPPPEMSGLIDLEGLDKDGLQKVGRQKLVVAMPDLGGIVVIDAQSLLDRTPGSFDPCPVERWLPLDADIPMVASPPPFTGSACVSPKIEAPQYKPPYKPRPSGLSFANGRLYASDLSAPVIHVIDLPTPCDPVETDPLLPTSVIDPKRVVTTSRVAVTSALTPDLKRYLYAVDSVDGSAMVFDVSDDHASRFPLSRLHPEWDPLDPPDRIKFAAPIADLLTVERDVPAVHPATGVAAHGTRCDPDPTRVVCDPHSQSCDVATLYRTASDYTSGAGPDKLRGEFAFFALTSGKVAVIDVDDYDARCRQPYVLSPLSGCQPDAHRDRECEKDDDCPGKVCVEFLCTKECKADTDCPQTPVPHACVSVVTASGTSTSACELMSSAELSCNIVIPNTPRLSSYEVPGTALLQKMPGIQVYPLLYDQIGALISSSDTTAPRMVATIPPADDNGYFLIQVGSTTANISRDTGEINDDGIKNTLALNLEDPRAQLIDQNWSVTFEGPIPGFGQQAGKLSFQTDAAGTFDDADGRFCDAGVLGEKAVREQLAARGLDQKAIDQKAPALADYVQIANLLPIQQDKYWEAHEGVCSFDDCQRVFGDADAPQPGRDLTITEAYQDKLEVAVRHPEAFTVQDSNGKAIPPRDLIGCCFPTLMSFNVRAGGQWVVSGSFSLFQHHVIADPATGVCRNSCDPRLARQNGRVPESPEACIDDRSCGGPTSGRVCDDSSKTCVRGCRGGPNGTGCPDGKACSSMSATIGTCPSAPTGSGIADGEPGAFINPMFRFAVLDGKAKDGTLTPPKRDQQFRFTTQGSFTPLFVDLSAGVSALQATDTSSLYAATPAAPPLIQPVGITLVPATGELAVTDGSINGLIIVNLASVGVSKAFY